MIEAALRHHQAQAALGAATITRARRLWRQVDTGDIGGSFNRLGGQLFVLVASAQMTAASSADDYVNAALAEQNLAVDAAGEVNPRAFVGASDGRDLETLLFEPVVTAKVAISAGQGLPRAMGMAEASLIRIVQTQVADAGRTAVGAGITARPKAGWVRQLNPPSCSRCAVLAGRFFRFNTGFQRHPHCDCVHIPTAESVAGDVTTDPRAYFDSLDTAGQDRYFTKAGAQAIRDGADIGQVVNARRGMSTAHGFTTTSGSHRRGTTRLMPEGIYETAADRAEAVALLRQHGYLI